jgi:aryl-alcohol dehydrogenase-like predicted oxidoreductase
VEYRNVGRSGLLVSVTGLGCNNFGMRIDKAATADVVHAALDEGITLFDTSDSYGDGQSEEFLGAALAGRRDDVVIATKFGNKRPESPYRRGAARRWIRQAVEASLRRLGTDRIDLYQLHFPDERTPMEETLAALTDLVHDGKVLYIGSSNLAGWQIADAEWIARTSGFERFVSAQNEWSLLSRRVEREVVPAAERFDIGVLPFFPLASGMLTGKYRRGEPFPEGTRFASSDRFAARASDANFDRVEALARFAEARGWSLTTLAFAWLAAQPSVPSVIAGATRPEQVKENAATANASSELSAADLAEIDELLDAAKG